MCRLFMESPVRLDIRKATVGWVQIIMQTISGRILNQLLVIQVREVQKIWQNQIFLSTLSLV